MSLAGEASNFLRLATGLRAYLKGRVTLEEGREIIKRRLAAREAMFLGMVERGIFGVAGSPYRALLAAARCAFADIEAMVRSKGVEATLRSLRDAGVYVTFDEFKGREPLVRHGTEIPLEHGAFYNPSIEPHYWIESSGSTGTSTRMGTDLARLGATTPYFLVANDAHGLSGKPRAIWRAMLPAGAGINPIIATATTADMPSRWFTPLAARDLTSSRKYPLATYTIVGLARLFGTPMPWPEYVPLERAIVVAKWAIAAAKAHGASHVSASASMAMRVALAARDAGLRLDGVTLSGGGEPMTEAKARRITENGARVIPAYFATETGPIGMSCGNAIEPNDQHLFADSIAMIQVPRRVPGFDAIVNALNVTCLLPSASYIMLNVELDDYAIVEERACGCPFEALGFTTHIRRIRSFRKLTGEGVTLVGTDMERILDDVLPSAFGGSPLDYQLVEEEDAGGLTRLALVVSPRVALTSEAAVIDTVLRALAGSGAGADHARATWRQAGTISVVRREPVWNDRGKLQTLQLVRSGDAGADAPRPS